MANERRTTTSQVLETIGFLATLAAGAFVLITIAFVWITSSSLSDLRDKFYDTRSSAARNEQSLEWLSKRTKDIEDAWNKAHPDAKVNTPPIGGFICGGTCIIR